MRLHICDGDGASFSPVFRKKENEEKCKPFLLVFFCFHFFFLFIVNTSLIWSRLKMGDYLMRNICGV